MAAIFNVLIVGFFLLYDQELSLAEYAGCFSDKRVMSLPSDHLFSTKDKPLVIAHRGNPTIFQENTLEGFRSLLSTNADGFELDIFLTKDEQLVVFHDDNTMKLTGENYDIWDMTYEQIQKLNIKATQVKGNRTWKFATAAKIPLLKDVLDATKGTGLVMYLEIKPSYPRDFTESQKVGRAVAQLVRSMGLERQAMINSFDPLKTLAAKQENPAVPVGTFFKRDFWLPKYAQTLKSVSGKLPGMNECVEKAPNGTEFVFFLLQSGSILKAINGSFLDMDYRIYDNPDYSNDTFKTLRTNYSSTISAGAWTLYSMSQNEAGWAASESQIDSLIKQGAERLITDNVTRLLEKLERPITRPPTASPPKTSASTGYQNAPQSLFAFCIFIALYLLLSL